MSELQGIARFRFHEGMLDEFKRLTDECMEIVRAKDTGTLRYEVYFNEDESEAIVLERFTDSQALLDHAANLSHLMDAVIATGSVNGELLGDPSAEIRANLTPDGPVRLFQLYRSM